MTDKPRVRVYLGCSLDGCIAGPDGDLSFLTEYAPEQGEPSDGLEFEDFIKEIGAILMGRQTYQIPLDYDAWHYGDIPVLVATHRDLPPAPQGGTSWAVSGPIEDLIAQAKHEAGAKDVYLDGGDLVRQAIDAGLVDEICLTYLPLILGNGIRLWEGLQTRTNWEFSAPTSFGKSMVQIIARKRLS